MTTTQPATREPVTLPARRLPPVDVVVVGGGSAGGGSAGIAASVAAARNGMRTANVLVAGRCLSADHVAATSARVIPPCYATGEAAGTAAGLAVNLEAPCREVDTALLRQLLREQGALV